MRFLIFSLTFCVRVIDITSQYDRVIYMNSIRLAKNFINNCNKSELINDRECVIVLKYLMSMLLSNKTRTYITSKELRQNLTKYANVDYTSQYFKTKIIARLRDSNVLIASSSKGYKLPESELDLLRFFNHTNSIDSAHD